MTGLKTNLSSQPVKATSLPLPTTLSGISITLNQNRQQPALIALLSVQQISICGNSDGPPPSSEFIPDCFITAITVQIPFELVLPPRGVTAELVVGEDGNQSKAFRVLPVSDNLHILNGCDAFPAQRLNTCDAVAAHADGTPVTSDSPAKAGETVVIYAFGLGQTTPAVKTGEATPATAPNLLTTTVTVDFDFRPNATASHPYNNPGTTANPGPILPIFAGLTPGQVGLYQININYRTGCHPLFRVPHRWGFSPI